MIETEHQSVMLAEPMNLLILGAIFSVIILLNLTIGRRSEKDGSWHEFNAYKPRKLLDRTETDGLIMRRWADGAWEFRQMTPEEVFEHHSQAAW